VAARAQGAVSDGAIVLDHGRIAGDRPVLEIAHDVMLMRRSWLIFEHRHRFERSGSAAHGHSHGA
jgi:hypothetical protein